MSSPSDNRNRFILPHSWSELSWKQLNDCWAVKMRYGGSADVTRVAAMLKLLGLKPVAGRKECYSRTTGEREYLLRGEGGRLWTVTPRELSQQAAKSMTWFDWPYGDPGEKEVADEKGVIVKPRREGIKGYVGPMSDALSLPVELVTVHGRKFALPQVTCNNLTWQQYRTLQTITPQLFAEGVSDDDVLDLQAKFLAHCLSPRSAAVFDTTGGSICLRPHYEYRYNAERADGLAKWCRKKLSALNSQLSTLFHICFQCYQTALGYYAIAYPLLFGDDGKNDTVRDALQGEVGTINTVMKYAGYAEQQQVYDSNLPFVLDILNTMAREAKEIEKMNAKIKK